MRRKRYHPNHGSAAITEAELAGNVHAVLAKVRQGIQVVNERDDLPVAVIQTPQFRGRDIDKCIASMTSRDAHAAPDDDFASDVQAAIDAHREPIDPPEFEPYRQGGHCAVSDNGDGT